MKICVVRKVPYRLPGTTRLVWGVILAQREGLSLLFIQAPDEEWSHTLAIATENVQQGAFEDANVSRFPLERADMGRIGKTLQALGKGLSEVEFQRLFRPDDGWQP